MTRNWVAVGLSKDLPPGVAMPAIWHGKELAVWRSASGVVSAWNDRCPHRGMRLSHGFVRGETLACIYHGWVYGTDGGCTRIPAHPDLTPPAAIRAERFFCREAHGLIWIGDAAGVDDVPDLSELVALRSMTFRADGLPGFALSGDLARATLPSGATVALVLQPTHEGQIIAHAMIGAGDDAVAASRWLEGARRRIEEGLAA